MPLNRVAIVFSGAYLSSSTILSNCPWSIVHADRLLIRVTTAHWHFQKFELTSLPRRLPTQYLSIQPRMEAGVVRPGGPFNAGIIISPCHSNVATPRFHRTRVNALPTAGLRLFVNP